MKAVFGWLVLGLGLNCVAPATRASSQTQQPLRPGVTVVADTSSDGVVTTVAVGVGTAPKAWRALRGYWGTEHGSPAVLVTSLVVAVATDTIEVPFTAWMDLGYPTSIRLSAGARGATITLEGGDTATHYSARWLVVGKALYRRRVELSEFPDDVWQETVYSRLDPDTNDF